MCHTNEYMKYVYNDSVLYIKAITFPNDLGYNRSTAYRSETQQDRKSEL